MKAKADRKTSKIDGGGGVFWRRGVLKSQPVVYVNAWVTPLRLRLSMTFRGKHHE